MGIDNNNPFITIPYKYFNSKNYFDLSYKKIIFEPLGDKYRVMTNNGLVNNEGSGLFDTYFTNSSNRVDGDNNGDIYTKELPIFYDKKIKSINYNEKGFFTINTFNLDGTDPDVSIDSGVFYDSNETITNVNLEDFFNSQNKNISPYFYNFKKDGYTKSVYADENFLIIQFINLRVEGSDYNFSFEFRIKLSNLNENIFTDDYKKGTIIFSYSKTKTNEANPIIGMYNGDPTKTQETVDEVDYLRFIDSQWVDDNGFGVPSLKMSLSRDGEEKILITDNDWNSYYSRVFNGKQYYVRIIDITPYLYRLEDRIIKNDDVIKIQSIYDRSTPRTNDYSDEYKLDNLVNDDT